MAKRGRKPKIIVGQYECGCGFGPTTRKERLKYCKIHGMDIQDEYMNYLLMKRYNF